MPKIIAPFKPPRQEQHERIFLQDAINRYKARLTTASGFIYSLIRIYRQQGHKLNIPNPRSFYERFQIPKSTFYRALTQLEKAEGIDFHWDPQGGISMWWGGKEEASAVTPPTEEFTPEPKYQRLKQLPESIRAKFEQFVRTEWRKAKGEEIRSFHRFVEKPADFQAWWQKFQSQPQPQATLMPASEVEIAKSSIIFIEESERISPDKFKALAEKLRQRRIN
ncbi:hypothetical protein [Microcoleus anatoxicus]|uniref:hypothetical protein n=1 Tax=Microcoleus anatoxicus TaxID=2705319 RepID=UPI0030C8FC3F